MFKPIPHEASEIIKKSTKTAVQQWGQNRIKICLSACTVRTGPTKQEKSKENQKILNCLFKCIRKHISKIYLFRITNSWNLHKC